MVCGWQFSTSPDRFHIFLVFDLNSANQMMNRKSFNNLGIRLQHLHLLLVLFFTGGSFCSKAFLLKNSKQEFLCYAQPVMTQIRLEDFTKWRNQDFQGFYIAKGIFLLLHEAQLHWPRILRLILLSPFRFFVNSTP